MTVLVNMIGFETPVSFQASSLLLSISMAFAKNYLLVTIISLILIINTPNK